MASPGTDDPHGGTGAPWTLLMWAAVATAAIGTLGPSGALRVASWAVTAVFVVYFVRHLMFAIAAARWAPRDLDPTPIGALAHYPTVSVLVACHDEELVVRSLIESLERLRYPKDRIEFVLVDDRSRDATGALLDELCATRAGFTVLHRDPDAPGGKSAALNDGLTVGHGEIVVVFDADHEPAPDTVLRLVRHFDDPRTAAVMGRCVIRNAQESRLSGVIAIDYVSGYLVNEYGRQAVFELPAYGGANCAVRRSVIDALGGWNPRSVTEDTDLTLRAVLAGGKVRYDPTALDTEESVSTYARFWRQRYRWARGHQQAWRDYRRHVCRSPALTVVQKIETLLFLLVFHVPVVAAGGLVLTGARLAGVGGSGADVLPLTVFMFLGPMLELGTGMWVERPPRHHVLRLVYFFPAYVVHMAICTKAYVDGLLGRPYQWAKTNRSGRRDVPVGAAPDPVTP